MTTTSPDLTRAQLVFGREPAVWIALLQAVIAAVSMFALPLTTEQGALIIAFANAVLGAYLAYKVRPVTVALLVAVVQTALALLVGFGLNLTNDQQGVLLTLTSVILTAFIVRPASTPADYPVIDAAVSVDPQSGVVTADADQAYDTVVRDATDG